MTRSKTSVHNRIASWAIVATLFAASTQVQAQDAFVSLDVPGRPAAAAEMEQQAHDLLFTERGWEQAAGLYRRAADLRGSGDSRSADNLRLAGYLLFYRGRTKDAVLSLTQAGEAFLALGDVERAAQTFIDGAWVANEANMPTEAQELSGRGKLLTRSPLLGAEDRTALVKRLGEAAGIQ